MTNTVKNIIEKSKTMIFLPLLIFGLVYDFFLSWAFIQGLSPYITDRFLLYTALYIALWVFSIHRILSYYHYLEDYSLKEIDKINQFIFPVYGPRKDYVSLGDELYKYNKGGTLVKKVTKLEYYSEIIVYRLWLMILFISIMDAYFLLVINLVIGLNL